MPNISLEITNKRAMAIGAPVIICGNSDYVLQIAFDEEWAAYSEKTARFAYWKDGEAKHQDKVFSGTECPVPKLSGIKKVLVGVFAGDLHTTTPAIIPCELSILCGAGAPEDPPEDVYNQIMELLAVGGGTGGSIGPAGPQGPQGIGIENISIEEV